jgi:hypothetical protein
MDITGKIDRLLEAEIKPAKLVYDIINKIKGWEFQYYKNRQSEFYYVLNKPGKYYEYMVKIEIPYFDDLYDGKKVTANVSHYDGDELVSNNKDIIYNWKGLESVLKKNKSIADKMYSKSMKESEIKESASPYLLMKREIERQLENRPKDYQLKFLDRYWIEMSKNKKSKWWQMNNTEKKSITNWFNKVTSAIKAGENPIGF